MHRNATAMYMDFCHILLLVQENGNRALVTILQTVCLFDNGNTAW
jgi:hypothetical protein